MTKLKNILAENMYRFGTKNLHEQLQSQSHKNADTAAYTATAAGFLKIALGKEWFCLKISEYCFKTILNLLD